jgi:hypothetical protein
MGTPKVHIAYRNVFDLIIVCVGIGHLVMEEIVVMGQVILLPLKLHFSWDCKY